MKQRDIEKVSAVLERADLRPTAQRLAICHYMLFESDHPTADDVKTWADRNFPKMSTATVYNTLNALVDRGLVTAIKFPHSDSVIYDHNTDHHHHFLDEKTGKLYDVDADDIRIASTLNQRCEIRQVEVLIRGNMKPGRGFCRDSVLSVRETNTLDA